MKETETETKEKEEVEARNNTESRDQGQNETTKLKLRIREQSVHVPPLSLPGKWGGGLGLAPWALVITAAPSQSG